MRERSEDVAALQALLERSIAEAGPFLRSSFQIPQCSMSAEQVVECFARVVVVAFATVTKAGSPRVAPIGALFWRGQFHIPTTLEAARTRHVLARPAVSLAWYDGIDRAAIVHGSADALDASHTDFAELDELHRELTGASVTEWGSGAYLRVVAEQFFTFDRALGPQAQEAL